MCECKACAERKRLDAELEKKLLVVLEKFTKANPGFFDVGDKIVLELESEDIKGGK